jgi:hypothetical protein
LGAKGAAQGWEASEVTAGISGEANVKKFQQLQRDFRSQYFTRSACRSIC